MAGGLFGLAYRLLLELPLRIDLRSSLLAGRVGLACEPEPDAEQRSAASIARNARSRGHHRSARVARNDPENAMVSGGRPTA